MVVLACTEQVCGLGVIAAPTYEQLLQAYALLQKGEKILGDTVAHAVVIQPEFLQVFLLFQGVQDSIEAPVTNAVVC